MTGAIAAVAAPLSARRKRIAPPAMLAGAACVVVIVVMGAPLALSFLASIKTPADASAVPPHYLPHALSFDNYLKVINFGEGLATYVANSGLVALITIAACIALAAPAGYGLARFTMRGKEIAFLVLLAPIMIPYQALPTPPIRLRQVGLVNSRVDPAIVHTILELPFSTYPTATVSRPIPREIEEAAMSTAPASRR